MTDFAERREEQRADLRRIYDKLEVIEGRVSGVDTKLQVHLAKFESIEEKVKVHEGRWKDIDTLKNRGLGYSLLALLASGALGGGIAHVTRKFFE